ncbi:sulfate adenylyltransferase [Limnochorda pilosa]|uniref:Multifunctional fusion protein n=2 Tax=Limnochorda pilosa TaxID=1555112 RepID=A0A0K2SQ01_LIMPI|nr:sulfate adenylyltransferase [Limnochorda pilosa]
MRGVTVWFTGLSGAGKTTVAKAVEVALRARGVRVERLDGDVVRQSLTRDLGFSREDRDRNIERVAFVAKLLTRNGVICLASFISPYRAVRAQARREVGEFLEVFVSAPMETLLERDVKGLYRKAMAGEIPNFTGVSDPYEPPEHPDLLLRTDQETVDGCAARVIHLLEQRGYLSAGNGAAHRVVLEVNGVGSAAGHGISDGGTVVARYEPPEGQGGRSAQRPWPGPVEPHGGVLVNRELEGEAREEALRRARELVAVELDERELADLEMIGVGALSPLGGFMRRLEYETVVETMRLADGLVWSMPVTLAVSWEEAARIREGQEVALVTPGDRRTVGLMHITEVFPYDRRREAERVFGTSDEAHPGVARLYRQGEVYLGGPVWVLDRPGREAFGRYRLTPAETRRAFQERGWRAVVAFQTRNPIHRAHEYIQKCALETVDGLLLHPLVGATKADDVPAEVRLRSYETILERYYPREQVLLAVFPAAMRYAGPREAVFHAISRKNYGCTHFIVGRDHAGVASYYGTYAAQEVFDRFRPDELGIGILKFEHSFFCRRCGQMATAKTCPHGAEDHVVLSGTRVRAMLRAGELPPPEFTRPEVAQVLWQRASTG